MKNIDRRVPGRNNLRIDEINKEKGETWEMCEIRLKIFFRRN